MTDTVTVPREPTLEMWSAGERAFDRDPDLHHETVLARVWAAMLAAAPKDEPVDAEVYLKEAISSSPQPLQDLGEFLSSVLDEDHWKAADKLLLAIATCQPEAQKGEPVGWRWRFDNDLSESMWFCGHVVPERPENAVSTIVETQPLYTRPGPASDELLEAAERLLQSIADMDPQQEHCSTAACADLQRSIAKHKGPQS